MQILVLILVMLVVGWFIAWLAGLIWKNQHPIGVTGDYLVATLTAVIIGLIDWFVIPAMGFSDTIKYLGVALEPAIGALLVLWLIRVAKR